MNNNKYTFLGLPAFFYIFCLAVLLRFYDLGLPSIWVDEAFSIWTAKFNLPTLIQYISLDAHPPLYFIFLHFWIKLFGSSEFAARSLSVLFNLGTLIVIYYLCLEMFTPLGGKYLTGFSDKKYAVTATLLFTVSSYAIINSATDIKMYSQLEFFTVLSSYLLYKLVTDKTNADDIRSFGRGQASPLHAKRCWLWAAYVIVLILNIYTHYYASFIVIAQMGYLFYAQKNKSIRARLAAPLRIIFILFLSYLPWINKFFNQALIGGRGEHLAKAGLMSLMSLFDVFFNMIFFKANYYATVFLFFLICILLILGFKKTAEHKNGALIIVLFLSVIVFSYAISFFTSKHIFQARYFSLIFPFFIILLTCGIISIKSRCLKFFILAAFIIFNLVVYYKCVSDPEYWKQDWRTVAKFINNRAKPGDVILLQISYNLFPFNYYYKNNALDITIRNASDGENELGYNIAYPSEYFASGGVDQYGMDYFRDPPLRWINGKYNKIFFILNAEQFYDKKRAVLGWLDKNCVFIEGIEVKNIFGWQSHITVGVFDTKNRGQKTENRGQK